MIGRASLLLLLAGLWSPAALAVGQSSTYPGCATRNVVVPWGGTVNVNLTTCHFFGLGVVSTILMAALGGCWWPIATGFRTSSASSSS